MADEPTKTRRAGWPIVCALIALPLLYTLSVGPAAYLVERTGTGSELAHGVYAPLIWLGENTPLGEPLEWCAQKWERAARKR
jgi:hypothetical protein